MRELGVAVICVICGFYLFIYLFIFPPCYVASEIPKLPTDPQWQCSLVFGNFSFFFNTFFFLTLQYYIGFAIYQHESTTGIHVFPILNLPPSCLPELFFWVLSVHQPQAPSIVHWTWTSDPFHIWYYSCFNAILPNHPILSFSHRVQKTVLYISVSFAVSYTGLSLPSF